MNEEKEVNVPMKFNPATQKYEPDMEKLEEKAKELNEQEMGRSQEEVIPEKAEEELKKEFKDKKGKKNKEGSFKPIIFVMIASLLIASLWDKLGPVKDAVHFALDPSAGALLNWNLNVGMLAIVLVITIITTLVQKYATDQDTLKELKKEQKEIQKQMKEFKNHPEKMMHLQKKQMAMMPKQMKLSMRGVAYTGIPFILFFRWFNDYFAAAGNPKFLFGMSWFLFYLITAIVIGSILRKTFDVV